VRGKEKIRMREMPVFGDPENLVEREEEEPAVFDGNAHELLKATYQGRYRPTPVQLRAAMRAIDFESAKLSAVAVMNGEGFSVMLERAIARSRAPLLIDHQPTDRELPPAAPPGIRGRSGSR
jgi:hypothetical protein